MAQDWSNNGLSALFAQARANDANSPGRQAVQGINRMPGVFSDYTSLATMPQDDIWKVFYKGSALEKDKNGIGQFGNADPVSDANNAFMELLNGMTDQQRQNFLAYVLDISNRSPE